MSADRNDTTRKAARRSGFGEVDLRTGRHVWVSRLHQSYAYEGLLCGLPHRGINVNQPVWAAQSAASMFPWIHAWTVLPLHYRIERLARTDGRPGPAREALPGVVCIAELRSAEPARDKSEMMSSLGVIWFQDEPAPPIAPEIVADIVQLDWEGLACDWTW